MINDQSISGAVARCIPPIVEGPGFSANEKKGPVGPVPVLTCPKCGSGKIRKDGHKKGRQVYQCVPCRHQFSLKGTGKMSEGEPKAEPEASGNSGYISLDAVCKKFDVKGAILREIGKIPKGKLIAETEFCARTAGKDRNRFRRCLDNNADEFRPYRIKLTIDDSSDGKYFWGRGEDIEQALRMRDL